MTAKQFKKFIWENPYKLGHILGYKDLNETHNYWIKYCWCSKGDVFLMAHRNSYKTTAIIVVGFIWFHLFFPDITCSIIRKSVDNASKVCIEITKHYLSEKMIYIYEKYFDMKGFKLTDYNAHKINLPTREKITKESNLECYGKGGNITGDHFDMPLLDDIVTDKDRYSTAEREGTKNFVREVSNIKKSEGRIIYTNTPWHPKDACEILFPKPLKFPIGSIEIKGFNETKIKELKKSNGLSLYACNYELKHIAEENKIFSAYNFMKWDDRLTSYAFCDPGYGGECSTALSLLQRQEYKIVIKGYAWMESVTECYSRIANICRENNCVELLWESNADKALSGKEMRKHFTLFRDIFNTENKHYRILYYIKKYMDRIYFEDSFINNEYVEEAKTNYIEQFNNYEEGQIPCDAPDSLSGLIREVVDKNISIKDSAIIKEVKEDYKF